MCIYQAFFIVVYVAYPIFCCFPFDNSRQFLHFLKHIYLIVHAFNFYYNITPCYINFIFLSFTHINPILKLKSSISPKCTKTKMITRRALCSYNNGVNKASFDQRFGHTGHYLRISHIRPCSRKRKS